MLCAVCDGAGVCIGADVNRRGFLKAILAAGVAPAVVGSSILMPVRMIVSPWNGFADDDIILTIEQFNQRYIHPAMRSIADDMDLSLITKRLTDRYVTTATMTYRLR